ncbi:BtpA/SgcQ family protein [Homoserinimonas sp. A447]
MTASTTRWHALFPQRKPILSMLHLGGEDRDTRLGRAVDEIAALIDGGVDGIIVENYFGDSEDVRAVLEHLAANRPGVAVGVNVLRDFERAFAFAGEFDVDFIQIDSVSGHLTKGEDRVYAERVAQLRDETSAVLLGGVRFKYQPVLSERSELEDVQIGMTRCDAIVVTGAGTGMETELSKLVRFRQAVGPDFPLVVGAGVTDLNVATQLDHANGAIVGSFLKDTYRDDGVVDREHVAALMSAAASAQAHPGEGYQ